MATIQETKGNESFLVWQLEIIFERSKYTGQLSSTYSSIILGGPTYSCFNK